MFFRKQLIESSSGVFRGGGVCGQNLVERSEEREHRGEKRRGNQLKEGEREGKIGKKRGKEKRNR